MKDLKDCINDYNIKDDDFVVKMTGRYVLEENSNFLSLLKNCDFEKVDCIIRYGSYFAPVNYKTNDCITGLIGVKASIVKNIPFPREKEPVEWNWAKTTLNIEDIRIIKAEKLGIYICPGSNVFTYLV